MSAPAASEPPPARTWSSTLERGGMAMTATVHEPATTDDATPTVLCLHGFPDTSATFGPLAERLATAGHRVVCPTLRGYEPSSIAPDGDYHLSTLAGDVIGWLDHLGLDQAHLFGHDWGACVAYATAAGHPERLRSVTASSVPPLRAIRRVAGRSPHQIAALWYQAVFQVPGLSERLLTRDRAAFAELLWRRWSPGWELPKAHLQNVQEALCRPGVAAATLAYYRQQLHRRGAPARATAALLSRSTEVPALVLAGADDRCLLAQIYPDAVAGGGFTAGVDLHVLEGVGHFPHLEQPDTVAELVLAHITRHGSTRHDGEPPTSAS